MGRNAFKEDFYFLYNTLLKHPFLLTDAEAERDFAQFYQSKADGVYSYDSLINAATKLTVWFQDGHTNIEVPYPEQDRCIPLHCGWDERGCRLVLSEKYEGFSAGTQIMAVNGMTVDNLISYIAGRISHENIYLVKSRMIAYPYQNYHLFSERNLKDLFGSQEEYAISFLINDEVVEKQCCLVKYNGFPDFADESDFINYEIQDNQMILHLNACIFNEKYKRTLAAAAQLCKESGITSFILDLSQNMGGNSAVIDEFITYTHAESYRRYEMTDYSSGKARQISSREKLIRNERKQVLFPFDLYCRVSCHTFSSARTFAVTLKDNGIARIIGSRTGGKPNSYGMPQKFQMPESKLRFRVSTSYFRRPDASGDDDITVEIDENVCYCLLKKEYQKNSRA